MVSTSLAESPRALEEIEDHAGIDRARSGPHAEPVQRRESERAVDALSVLHRAQAGAASQMRDDDAPIWQSPARPRAEHDAMYS